MSRGGNIHRVAYLQVQNSLVTESLSVVQNENNGHKDLNNNHNYHGEKHEEIELFQEIVKGAHNDTQHQTR